MTGKGTKQHITGAWPTGRKFPETDDEWKQYVREQVGTTYHPGSTVKMGPDSDPEACVGVVERLPTINRRVVLFVVSFLQLFLDDRVCATTKMTSANLALVMAPNLLRCSSDSMAVVFTNAQSVVSFVAVSRGLIFGVRRYEQTFVHNLLLHLDCERVDPDYVPKHGLGAASAGAPPRKSRSKRP